MENIFFTSDEHYGHRNIIKFCKRPFADINEMKEKLIENHNKVVKKGDLVYHLGDMFWNTVPLREALDIRYRLNGNHYYIYGNHDELFRHQILRDSFVWTKDLAKISTAGYPKIVLCHYAMRVWEGSHRGDWHLYGHSHAQLAEKGPGVLPEESPLSFDVGVDAQNYTPISIEEVAAKMKPKATAWETITFRCKCGHKFIGNFKEPIICAKCERVMVKE